MPRSSAAGPTEIVCWEVEGVSFNPLGASLENLITEAERIALEEAGGVKLSAVSRQLIEDALAIWIRANFSGNEVHKVPNKDVR